MFLFSSCISRGPELGTSDNNYILNVLGASEYLPEYWNPHSYNLFEAKWNITFDDKVSMFLHNTSEFGHIACGAWWIPNFLYISKVALKNVKSLIVSVDVYLDDISYNIDNAYLRMGIASTIIDRIGTHMYTELDFWESPALERLLFSIHPKYFNGSDMYGYKIDQIPVDQWITLEVDFMPYIKGSWGDVSQAFLESIYIVIESDCRNNRSVDIASLDVRNLIICVIE